MGETEETDMIFEDSERDKRLEIAKYLRDNKGSFFTARKLALSCGYKSSGTQEELRIAVKFLIEVNKMPIVSNEKGFGWAIHSNMVKMYAEKLERRRDGLQRRINAVKEIYERFEK